MFVAGVQRKIPSRFRRARSASVGPLTIEAPVMLEMEIAGVVSGATGPVVGIVGYDLFRRAVVEMPPQPDAHILLHDPATFVPDPSWQWQSLAMVSNVPHLWALFTHAPDAAGGGGGAPVETPQPQLLMLDSGAGGSDAIFHSRAVSALGLERRDSPQARMHPALVARRRRRRRRRARA